MSLHYANENICMDILVSYRDVLRNKLDLFSIQKHLENIVLNLRGSSPTPTQKMAVVVTNLESLG